MSENKSPAPAVRPEIPRRRLDIPGMPSRPIDQPAQPAPESKRLIVGRDICLSGEITACDKLIVEGHVSATLSDSQSIDIASPGLFKGTAEVESADISGQFEGKLMVRKRLVIRATGRVTGEIRYGEIEVEGGGVISGDVRTIAECAPERAAAESPRGAAESPRRAAEPPRGLAESEAGRSGKAASLAAKPG